MARYLIARCRTTRRRVFAHFLALMLLEWTIFYVYLSVNGKHLVQKDDVSTYRLSDIPKSTKTTVKLIPQTQKTDNVKPLIDLLSCTKKEVRLSKLPLPVTGLASFPGAGNTWVRHLIQQMTGLATASMYCDNQLRTHGFFYECSRERQRTVVVKTHEEDHYTRFKRVVLVIRNPYDALLAYASMTKAGHTGHPSKHVMRQASNKMFNWSLWWYTDLTNGTLTRFKGPVYIVQYERLKTDMALELRKLSTFLKVNVTDYDIACTVKLQEGNFHRRTNDAEHLDLLRTVYDTEKLLRLQEAANKTAKLIKDTLNLDMDIGGSVEKLLLQNVTDMV